MLHACEWDRLLNRVMAALPPRPRDEIDKLDFTIRALDQARELAQSLRWLAGRDRASGLDEHDAQTFDRTKLALRHMMTGLELILGSARASADLLADERTRLDLLHAAKMTPGLRDAFLAAAAEHDPREDEEAMSLLANSQRNVEAYMAEYGTASE